MHLMPQLARFASEPHYKDHIMIDLKKPTYQYLTTETAQTVNSFTKENAAKAISELDMLLYANTYSIALACFKSVVLPFLVKYNYALTNGSLNPLPCSTDPSLCELESIQSFLDTESLYSKAPTLGSLMPDFNPKSTGRAIDLSTGNEIDIIGFEMFDSPCPSNWIGGFLINYGNSAATGWLRPDELAFNENKGI